METELFRISCEYRIKALSCESQSSFLILAWPGLQNPEVNLRFIILEQISFTNISTKYC